MRRIDLKQNPDAQPIRTTQPLVNIANQFFRNVVRLLDCPTRKHRDGSSSSALAYHIPRCPDI